MQFNSPAKGKISLKQVIREIVNFIKQNPNCKYKIIIGSDSSARGKIDFVTALIIHKVGQGGRYFWRRVYPKKIKFNKNLRPRIYKEVELSLELAQKIIKGIKPCDLSNNLEIHIDVGENGDTREMIKEVVGMVRGNGFNCYTKPNSFGASIVADKHVK